MKPLYLTLQAKLMSFTALLTIGLLASCGSYNNTTPMEDGIYGSDTNADEQIVISEDKNSYYQQYFKTKAENMESLPEEDAVFTDVEAYSTYESMDQDGYIVEQDYEERYGSWGENDSEVTINVYNNGWGNYNYWNYGYYNYWGYNNYYFRPGWSIGFGYGGYGPINQPYVYGLGYGSYYNSFVWNGGYYGNPYGYYNPYRGYGYGNGYYNNGYAYHGTRDNYRGRSNYDYSSRRNTTGLAGRSSARSNDRNSFTRSRDNNVRDRGTVRNSVNSRSRTETMRRANTRTTRPTTTRPTTRSRANTNSRSTTRKSSNTRRSRPNVQRPTTRNNSSSGSVRSSSGSSNSRSSGSSRRGSTSRRGGGI